MELPFKCPVAPLEFNFLADWYFHEQGIRDKVDITYSTVTSEAFTKPVAAKHLSGSRSRARTSPSRPTSTPSGSIPNAR